MAKHHNFKSRQGCCRNFNFFSSESTDQI